MIEVDIRHDETPVIFKQATDLGKLLVLKCTDVLEDALGDDDVEPLAVEADGSLEKVVLQQVWGRIVNRDVDPVIADVIAQHGLQLRWSAPDIQQVARPVAGNPLHKSCCFAQSIMRRGEFEILGTPEFFLIELYALFCAIALQAH